MLQGGTRRPDDRSGQDEAREEKEGVEHLQWQEGEFSLG